MQTRRTALNYLALLGLTPLGAMATNADTYPDKMIRLVNPYAAGSSVDIVGRMIGERLTSVWKQPVVVESRTGAGGTVGASVVTRAPADGYTLFVSVSTPLTVAPWVFKRLPYDPVKDLVPVFGITSGGLSLVVRKDFPAKNLKEFVAYLKANPGQVRYGTAGIASPQHLSGELFQSKTGTKMIHVPYQGAVPAMTDMIGGHVDVMFDAVQHVLPHVRAGKINGLAMLRAQRSPVLPDLPTAREQGIEGVETPGSVSIYAPGNTPPAILAKLESTILATMNHEPTKRRLLEMGMTNQFVSGKEMTELLKQERELYRQVVSAAKIEPQ